jgi:hypothetical protein
MYTNLEQLKHNPINSFDKYGCVYFHGLKISWQTLIAVWKTTHFSHSVKQFLNAYYPDQWTGLNKPVLWPLQLSTSLLSNSTTEARVKEMVYLKKVNIWDQLQHLIEVAAVIQHMLESTHEPGIPSVTGLSYTFKHRALSATF